MKKYEKYFTAIMLNIWSQHGDGYCKELEEKPYNFYQGQVVFEDDENLEKIKELDIHEQDKVKIGVIFDKRFNVYLVDIIEKLN